MASTLDQAMLTLKLYPEAAKLATYHAATVYDLSGKDPNETSHAVGVACNSAKYLAAEAAFTACERSVSPLLLLKVGHRI